MGEKEKKGWREREKEMEMNALFPFIKQKRGCMDRGREEQTDSHTDGQTGGTEGTGAGV